MGKKLSSASPGQTVPPASKSAEYTAQEAIDAIRLAVAAGADRGKRTKVIDAILSRAPEADVTSTRSVGLLIEAMRASGAEFRVTDHEPRGRLAAKR